MLKNGFGMMITMMMAGVVSLAVTVAPSPKTTVLNVASNEVAAGGFTVQFSVNLDGVSADESLYEIPGALSVHLRMAGKDAKLGDYDGARGNYLNFPLPGGACPVLEAVIPGAAGRVGIPLGFLKNPQGVHRVTLQYTGAHWSICVDGNVDDDMPFTPPAWPVRAVGECRSPRVASAQFFCPAKKDVFPAEPDARPVNKPIQYFTPADHNAWVGDVATGWFKNRYHIFYLFDRRHHGSKGGKGGHYFAHLSSTDLVHWVEHPLAVPIEAQWETLGTGTPFVYEGKLHLAYGLHSTRLFPVAKTTAPIQDAYCRQHHKMGVFKMGEIPGIPIGGTYSVSEDDGIHFKKSNILFHTSQNPTVYNRTDGKLGLVASYGCGGIFVSQTLGDWVLEDNKIPVSGDCPCLFEWNGWYYILQGFTGFCASPDGRPGSYVDWVAKGDDIYEGLAVPMVSPFTGNRRIMAGWIDSPCGWGGWLCLRELIQYPDGVLGSKWVKECLPDVPRISLTEEIRTAKIPRDGRVRFDWTLSPEKGAAFLRFTPEHGTKHLELQIRPKARRAQFANTVAGVAALQMPTLREWKHPVDPVLAKRGASPNKAESFAIGHIRGMEQSFPLHVITWYDPKSNVTIFDAEIAGQRTMVCRRSGRYTEVIAGFMEAR